MSKQTIKDVNVKGKKVLVRVDFNVPMDKETGTKITDENRILGALPTIKYLVDEGAAVILCSHICTKRADYGYHGGERVACGGE